MDSALSDYLGASTEASRSERLTQLLLSVAEPVIGRVLRQAVPDAEHSDLRSQCFALLIERLRQARGGTAVIEDFRAYASTVARHVAHSWMRDRKPNRTRMSHRIRYLVENDKTLAGWCTDARSGKVEADAYRQLAGLPLRELLITLKARLREPMALADLVTLVCEIHGVRDETPGEADVLGDGLREFDLAARIDHSAALRTLWEEVHQLPLRQRHAILLHLDGIEYLPASGIASFREIAAALEIPQEELAEIWSKIPLEDRAIANRFGVERQQVINLRKSGRERLARRLSARFGPLVISLLLAALLAVGRLWCGVL